MKGESAEPLRPQDGQEGAGNAGDPKEAGHHVELGEPGGVSGRKPAGVTLDSERGRGQ